MCEHEHCEKLLTVLWKRHILNPAQSLKICIYGWNNNNGHLSLFKTQFNNKWAQHKQFKSRKLDVDPLYDQFAINHIM